MVNGIYLLRVAGRVVFMGTLSKTREQRQQLLKVFVGQRWALWLVLHLGYLRLTYESMA
jgi:hypothetical protein